MAVFDPGREYEQQRQDDMIIAADLSPERVEKFRSDYAADRERSATAEMLFDGAGVYEHGENWNDEAAFGFNVLLHKGPFVDNSSWLEYQTWPFAVAMQRRLFTRMEENLLAGAKAVRSHGPKLKDMLDAADDLAERMQQFGYNPSLVILAGGLSSELAVEFWQYPAAKPDWDLGLPSELFILGSYRGILVADLAELSSSGVYVADLSRLGTLTKHGEHQFEVTRIDDKRARTFLRQKEMPEDASEIRSLMLQVHLKLYESFSIELKDQGAVLHSAAE